VDSILRDTRDTTYDDYRPSEMELVDRANAIPAADDLPPGPFSPDDPRIAAVDWISVDDNGYVIVKGKVGWGDDPADIALLSELHAEAKASWPSPGVKSPRSHFGPRDALAEQERREYTECADRLTAPSKPASPPSTYPPRSPRTSRSPPRTPRLATSTPTRPPATYPRNAIERAIDDTTSAPIQ
jgi:hypothetical protein